MTDIWNIETNFIIMLYIYIYHGSNKNIKCSLDLIKGPKGRMYKKYKIRKIKILVKSMKNGQ